MQIKSVLFSKANGSIGGLTGGQDQGGQYLRKKIQPRKKQTAMQKKHTDYFKEGNKLFKTIRPYWYGVWAEYALTLTKTNALGIETAYSPAQAFMRSYVVYRQTDRDPVDLLRKVFLKKGFNTAPFIAVSITNFNSTILIRNNLQTNQYLLVLISDNVSVATNKYRGGYKAIGYFELERGGIKLIIIPKVKSKIFVKVIRYDDQPRVSKPVIYQLFKTTQEQ